jgi:hypothetical protein
MASRRRSLSWIIFLLSEVSNAPEAGVSLKRGVYFTAFYFYSASSIQHLPSSFQKFSSSIFYSTFSRRLKASSHIRRELQASMHNEEFLFISLRLPSLADDTHVQVVQGRSSSIEKQSSQ